MGLFQYNLVHIHNEILSWGFFVLFVLMASTILPFTVAVRLPTGGIKLFPTNRTLAARGKALLYGAVLLVLWVAFLSEYVSLLDPFVIAK